MREEILNLLSGQKIDKVPAFSGLIHVTSAGVESKRLLFHETHKDAHKMAKASASTFRLTGIPSAALPLDMCVEAEALGAQIDFRENGLYEFPLVAKPLFDSTKFITGAYLQSADFINKGRIPLICKAIEFLKQDVGSEVVISGMIPGPYTLLLFLIEPGGLFAEMKREPNSVLDALLHLSSFLVQVGKTYRDAGADFITIHDMGGSPGFIGPAKYEQFVFPSEKSLIEQLPKPRVLSVCGNVTKSLQLLNETGAEAISLDQTVNLKEARLALKDTLLFGNIDPVAVLWQGDEAQVRESVSKAKEAGVDAVWPGCDLVPQTRIENTRLLH